MRDEPKVQYETQPTDEVITDHRRDTRSPVRQCWEPQVELVLNSANVEGSDAPNEVYRLTFQVDAGDIPIALWAVIFIFGLGILFVIVASLILGAIGDSTS
jgi:hypothetical protein